MGVAMELVGMEPFPVTGVFNGGVERPLGAGVVPRAIDGARRLRSVAGSGGGRVLSTDGCREPGGANVSGFFIFVVIF